LKLFYRENAPGQAECDKAGEIINEAIKKINNASIAAVSDALEPTSEDSLKVSRIYLFCCTCNEIMYFKEIFSSYRYEFVIDHYVSYDCRDSRRR
jgi:hypothetical protein